MRFFFTSLCFLVGFVSHAQKKLDDALLLVGTWKGTSICQVRPSPCNDEISVYHIMESPKPNIYRVVMNKVVNDKEEDMATYDYYYDASTKILSCWDEKHKIAWKFHVTGNRMEGTLVYQDKVYRIIRLSKVESN